MLSKEYETQKKRGEGRLLTPLDVLCIEHCDIIRNPVSILVE